MKVYSVVSNKGGCGKTCLAVNIAIALHVEGQSGLIIDCDPQATATVWGQQREEDEPGTIPAQGHQIKTIIEEAASQDCDYVVIDTPPHSDQTSLAAARVADVVLIPVRPSLPDIAALSYTDDLVSLAKKRKQAHVIINSAPTKGMQNDAQNAIKEIGLNLAPAQFWQRVAFSHSFNSGQGVLEYEPSGKAASEVKRLMRWLSRL